VKEFKPLDSTQIEARLEKAKEAFERYRRKPFIRRVQSMMSAAELLEREKERLARIITLEMGKLLEAGMEEIMKCARGCTFYAENAERFLADQTVQTMPREVMSAMNPLGRCLRSCHGISILAGIPFCRARTDGRQCLFD
jgi:succinate-semialdehyde dehydrogenase/glutarate-semialdehyde dehydrogenase